MSKPGDRQKFFENRETSHAAMPGLPLLARLDGRSFHSYTKGLDKPFSLGLQHCMVTATKHLVDTNHATIGYTQSDEITLLWMPTEGEFLFDGKYQKLCSTLASSASVAFYKASLVALPEKASSTPTFDCRVWQVPSISDVLDVFVWREDDAVKNSISMLASSVFSVRELHGKTSSDRIEMLYQRDVSWSGLMPSLKRGTYVRKVTEQRTLTECERERIPEKFRKSSETTFTRSSVVSVEMPRLRHIENLAAVLTSDAVPLMKTCTQNNRGDL